jgi:hypothetical protein
MPQVRLPVLDVRVRVMQSPDHRLNDSEHANPQVN